MLLKSRKKISTCQEWREKTKLCRCFSSHKGREVLGLGLPEELWKPMATQNNDLRTCEILSQQRVSMPGVLLFQKQERRLGHCRKTNPEVSRKFLYPESPTLLLSFSAGFTMYVRKWLCWLFLFSIVTQSVYLFFFSFLNYSALLEGNGRHSGGRSKIIWLWF